MLEINEHGDNAANSDAESRFAPLVSAAFHLGLIALLLFSPPSPSPTVSASDSKPTAQPIMVPRWQATPAVVPQLTPRSEARTQELGPDAKQPDLPAREAGEQREVDPDQIDPNRKLEEGAPQYQSQASPPPLPNPAGIAGPLERKSVIPEVNPSPLAVLPLRREEGKGVGTGTPPSSSLLTANNPNSRAGFSRSDAQNWRPSFENAAGSCVEIPDLGVDEKGNPIMASVRGRVYWPDHVRPLAGAHLQIVGTRFSTFSNADGEYLLSFDPHLLEKCRIQYVQVRATGFQGELLTLSIGEKVVSDDVVLRRK